MANNDPPPRRPVSLQLMQAREKLAEVQMQLEDKDKIIEELRAKLEIAEKIAVFQHSEMTAQDHIHADELEKIHTKLTAIHADITAIGRKP